MKPIDTDTFNELLRQWRVSRRLVRELRYAPDVIGNWEDRDFLAVTTRSGNEGVLVVPHGDTYALVLFWLTRRVVDTRTGKTKPIICDFCYTWQPGGSAAAITCTRQHGGHTFTFLCCGDLDCSLHVRDMTTAATRSRTQVREDITPEGRVDRLQRKLHMLLETLDMRAGVL